MKETPDKMRVYFHGNCQARSLALTIQVAFPEWTVDFYEVFSSKILDEIESYYFVVANADIVISQPIHLDYRNREDLSFAWIKSTVKANAAVLVFPSMYFDGQLIGVSGLGASALEMDYHDVTVLKLLSQGMCPKEIVDRLESPDLFSETFIESEVQRSVAELIRRERDDAIDVPFSPFLKLYSRDTQLFHTVNHPCRPAFAWMIRNLIYYLGYKRDVSDRGQDYLPFPHIPLSQSVSAWLDDSSNVASGWAVADSDMYHFRTGAVTRKEYVARLTKHFQAASGDLQLCLSDHRATRFLNRASIAMPDLFGTGDKSLLTTRSAADSATVALSGDSILHGKSLHDLMMRFESLGGSGHGCEFGLVRRAAGVETLGLLRWADLAPDFLINALRAQFAGVGDAVHTEVFTPADDVWGEWWTRDKRYWMAMRTFIKVADVSQNEAQRMVEMRQRFLAKKVISDLRSADKIFVYKSTYDSLPQSKLDQLHASVRSYGNNILLYIQLEDSVWLNGAVRCVAPGLLIGYIDHFAFSANNEYIGASTEGIINVCKRATDLVDGGRAYADGIRVDNFDSVDEGLAQLSAAVDTGDDLLALAYGEAIIQREPTHSAAYLRLIPVLERLRRDLELEKLIHKGVAHCPRDAPLHVTYAKRAENAGDFDEARKRWADAFTVLPDHPAVRDRYAEFLESSGAFSRALSVRSGIPS